MFKLEEGSLKGGWRQVGVSHVFIDPTEGVFTGEGHQSALAVRDGSHTVECA